MRWGPLQFYQYMSNGLITLTTDFGTSDHFVGTMKGVILGIAPKARIVDITHDIPPYDVSAGALEIEQAWKFFPKGSIHVVVIDPGVGSDRRPLLAEAGGHFFIAPDNGVLSMVFGTASPKVRVISNPKLMLENISRTFHGRDVFAPAAAHLATGTKPAQFGKLIDDYAHGEMAAPKKTAKHQWRGTILKIDRFGNLITNFHVGQFGDVKTRPFEVRVRKAKIHRLALNYAETELGELFLIVGSSGYLEIGANQASAAQKLKCGTAAPVDLEIYFTK
jgi:S-adenosyl-L-methionine hydrolase (adenosine-forming)